MLDRRHCAPEDAILSCGICGGPRETLTHLFFTCSFSKQCSATAPSSSGWWRRPIPTVAASICAAVVRGGEGDREGEET